jgi:undecaprenyl-diphosphatase
VNATQPTGGCVPLTRSGTARVTSLLARLDSHDRAAFQRLLLDPDAAWNARALWTTLTHAGGATCTILLVLLPMLLAGGAWHAAAVDGAWILALSHGVVQLAKRSATRPRPSVREGTPVLVVSPDAFSFPSGHGCAAMAVGLAYAATFPSWGVVAVGLAVIVGLSRVRLGVHYPGDVIAGQAIAVLTALGVWAWR